MYWLSHRPVELHQETQTITNSPYKFTRPPSSKTIAFPTASNPTKMALKHDPIWDDLCHNLHWVKKMLSDYGISPILASQDFHGKDRYIVLFLTKNTQYALQDHPKGLPLRGLLLDCLHPWKASEEHAHEVVLTQSNITFNISSYCNTIEPRNFGCYGDLDRFFKREDQEIEGTFDVIAYDKLDLGTNRIVLHGDALLVLVDIIGSPMVWTFYRSRPDDRVCFESCREKGSGDGRE